MAKEIYNLNTWYTLTDNESWVDFDNCKTPVFNDSVEPWNIFEQCTFGWGTMAKQGTWVFMTVEKPKDLCV
jgi:hypothetical protein